MIQLRAATRFLRNRKLDKYFILRKSDHPMDLRKPEKYKVTRTNTERFKNSSIPYMQKLLNQLDNNEEQALEITEH